MDWQQSFGVGGILKLASPVLEKHMQLKEHAKSEAAILTRVIQPKRDDLSPSAARALLKFTFPEKDRKRMHELAVKNQDGTLTAAEEQELDAYVRIGQFVDLLAAKARLSLKKSAPS
jgi:hypothetical protein